MQLMLGIVINTSRVAMDYIVFFCSFDTVLFCFFKSIHCSKLSRNGSYIFFLVNLTSHLKTTISRIRRVIRL